jgi:hypothetical protein
MRIAQIVKPLASTAEEQLSILKNAPQDASVVTYSKENDIYRMMLLCLDSWSPSEGMGGSEGVENWLSRTQLPQDLLDAKDHPFWTAIRHLNPSYEAGIVFGGDFLEKGDVSPMALDLAGEKSM